MRAMILRELDPHRTRPHPLEAAEWPDPEPGAGEVRIRVRTCGVCHTELDEIEGRLPPPRLPMILGHQAVGTVDALGAGVADLSLGDRVGVAWIFSACGECESCRSGTENLCPSFRATGRDAPGGYAERMIAPAAFVHPIPAAFSDAQAAPLLCAGAIGYRSLRLTGLEDGQVLGLMGFGASGHLVLQLARHSFPHSPVFVFARSDDQRRLARELGAAWAGGPTDRPPAELHAIIDTTPAWAPILAALEVLKPGGRLVINAIRKESADQESLLRLDYARHLWMEKEIKSVANVTRADVREFLSAAAEIPIRPVVEEFPLEDANAAVAQLRGRGGSGAKVLRMG